ncbi:hypothetical protein JQ596_22350 [Bradyrhizobium manausense]|uniref:hypothetical protein n=1 Tax=Bradyrhizobium TaxID=374 RepID=UPI001BA924B1|nr:MULTISPECIES: hypothetical protein [Bradyrhizobium]MBR0828282.1 hypothetical protein [Bradyrhizobium manausense]UVO25642.1 hypothetical protein KUF59_23950 [Bradyrhizobium arachidis]
MLCLNETTTLTQRGEREIGFHLLHRIAANSASLYANDGINLNSAFAWRSFDQARRRDGYSLRDPALGS